MNRDRVNNRPRTLRAYLRWAQKEYALEPPARLHENSIMDDHGDPAMTGEARGYLGFAQEKEPNDWREVACRRDQDGFYLTPMRCAIERIGGERGAFLRDLLVHVFHNRDVTQAHGVPDWAAGDVAYRSLEILWDRYREAPLPQRRGKSDAQLDAEAEAA